MGEPNAYEGILSGIRVLEIATYIFAPAAATVMSDFGAEVIKIENPPTGDPYRYLHLVPPLPSAEMDYCWILDGRNKKSVALNLQTEEGRDVLMELARRADVLITNFRPSIVKKLRLDYEDLQALNSRLIYAQVTGYGEHGDEVEKPGYDMTAYWARSGLMDNVHNGDSEPCLSLAGMGDHPSSMALFGAIMMALFDRERTGKGTKVSTSLMANGAWANACMIQGALCGSQAYIKRTRTTAHNAMVNHYAARDGERFILCCVQSEKDWPRVCRAIGRDDLIKDARFQTPALRRTNGVELIAIFDAEFAAKEIAEWKQIFAKHEIPWSPVATLDEIVSDPQMAANDVFIEFDHPEFGCQRTVNSPIFLQGSEKRKPTAAPKLGQHTGEVLREIGYAEESIEAMTRKGILR